LMEEYKYSQKPGSGQNILSGEIQEISNC